MSMALASCRSSVATLAGFPRIEVGPVQAIVFRRWTRRLTMTRRVPAGKPPFDPNTPGARKLLRAAQAAADQVDVVMTKGFFLEYDDSRQPIPRGVGDRLTLQRQLAEVLIAEGAAKRALQ